MERSRARVEGRRLHTQTGLIEATTKNDKGNGTASNLGGCRKKRGGVRGSENQQTKKPSGSNTGTVTHQSALGRNDRSLCNHSEPSRIQNTINRSQKRLAGRS